MAARPYSPGPSEGERLAIVLVVSLITEGARFLLHPANPVTLWLLAGGLLANFAYHAWAMPESGPKAVVSALLGQASTTPLVAIAAVAFWKVWAVVVEFLRALIPAP